MFPVPIAVLVTVGSGITYTPTAIRGGGRFLGAQSVTDAKYVTFWKSRKDRTGQLAKEATFQDMDLPMSVPLSHWKHLAWKRTVSSWNTEFLASPEAVCDKKKFSDHLSMDKM
ncbi:hypothetical protein TNCV_3785371 [Trichonephila clavipes]|nr:hypothetical protein TNCV_3785371 [Trichonephila clavipes]